MSKKLVHTQLTDNQLDKDFSHLFSHIAQKCGIYTTKVIDVKVITDDMGV